MTHQHLSYGKSDATLHDLQWQTRIVITSITSQDDLNELKQVYLQHQRAFEERQILIFAVEMDDLSVFGELKNTVNRDAIVKRLRSAHTLLIGLDGGNKVVYDGFDVRQIFADIDGMPMRRAELQK